MVMSVTFLVAFVLWATLDGPRYFINEKVHFYSIFVLLAISVFFLQRLIRSTGKAGE